MLPMSAAPRPAAAAARIAARLASACGSSAPTRRTESEDEIEILDREVDRERHGSRLRVLETGRR